MNNYWIIVDNRQMGPLTLEEIRRMPLQRDTLVWHPGLPSWRQASFFPELADAINRAQAAPQPAPEPTPAPEVQPTPPYTSMQQPLRRHLHPERRPNEPMPPTYLAWSIVAMLLCCIPTGIVALIYATKVEPRYEGGDLEGARKASDSAEMWLIVTIVAGIVWAPFSMVLAML